MPGTQADKVSLEHFKILQERAEELARETESDEAEGELLHLLTFFLSKEEYGVPIEFVEEVHQLEELTPIPCTPDFVLGVINLRGNILSVIDIRGFFNLPAYKITADSKIIVINACGLRVGILADAVQQIKAVQFSQIDLPIATLKGIEQEYVRGITKDMLLVLDVEALMGDDRLIIQEEVS